MQFLTKAICVLTVAHLNPETHGIVLEADSTRDDLVLAQTINNGVVPTKEIPTDAPKNTPKPVNTFHIVMSDDEDDENDTQEDPQITTVATE